MSTAADASPDHGTGTGALPDGTAEGPEAQTAETVTPPLRERLRWMRERLRGQVLYLHGADESVEMATAWLGVGVEFRGRSVPGAFGGGGADSFDTVVVADLRAGEDLGPAVDGALGLLAPDGQLLVSAVLIGPAPDLTAGLPSQSLLATVRAALEIREQTLVGGALCMVAHGPATASSTGALDDVIAGAAAELERQRGELWSARQRLEHANAAAADARVTAQAHRHRAEWLRRKSDAMSVQLAETRHLLQRLEGRKFIRIARLLSGVRRHPERLRRLPQGVLRVLRDPTRLPAAPERAGGGVEGLAVALDPAPVPDGPIRRPDLTVATILDPFSALCFKYEFRTLTPGPDDWREMLERDRPDFLLVESAWRGNDGAWNYAMTAPDAPKRPLVDLIAWCREQGIPTVFWNKEDPPNYDRFVATAKLFDRVFTVDVNCLPRYREDLGHDRIGVLPFAAQPRIHNPISVADGRTHDVAFAGTYFAEKHAARRAQMDILLDPARDFGLHIFSRQGGADPRYAFPEQYDPYIVGTVPYETMLTAYKVYKIFLNVNSVVDSPSMCARRIFELSACGTSVVSGESKAIPEFFGRELIPMSSSADETKRILSGLLGNDELRDRNALRAQRTVLSQHTFGHRVDDVLRALGIAVSTPDRSVSCLVPTNRPAQIDNLLDNVARQTHRPLELVVVLHGLDLVPADIERRAHEKGIEQVSIVRAAPELTLGTCMNMAVAAAGGTFLAKMDDDNYYGEHYLSDLMHAFDYTAAGIVGKWAHYAYLKARNATVLRFPNREHSYVNLVQGGTMVMRREVARDYPFADIPRAVDTTLLREYRAHEGLVYSADRFNFLSVRSGDPSSHTWTITDEQMLMNSRIQFYGGGLEHVSV